MPTDVYIAIGSNIGDSITIVDAAIDALDQISGCELTGKSSLYRSEAVSDIEQDDYINAAAKIKTRLKPMALLLELQAIEYAFYRQRDQEQRWAPRTLDLDIILFGNLYIEDSHLKIPHPEFSSRLFVLEPMYEIDGDQFIPGYGSLRYMIDHADRIDIEKLDRKNG